MGLARKDVALLIGFGLVVAGVYMINLPAALISAGILVSIAVFVKE